MSHVDVSLSLMLFFQDLLQSPAVNAQFNPLHLPVKTFLAWVHTSDVPAATSIMRVMSEKAGHRKSELRESMFLDQTDAALRELGTEQIRRILCAVLAVNTYALKNDRIRECFLLLYRNRNYGLTLLT